MSAPAGALAPGCLFTAGEDRANALASHFGVDLARAPITPLRVALAGCGTVGSALARQLMAHGAPGGRAVRIVSVLVRDPGRPRSCAIPAGTFTASLDTFLATPADVVVEAIGGTGVAHAIVRASLAAGRRVVTANKALIAAQGASLAALAVQSRTALDFEGAVGGSIPIVRALRSGAAGVQVRAIRGVLNGTSNFVLGRTLAGATLGDALHEARTRGFAEAMPDRDLDGRDAAEKVAILAWLAFGVAPHMLQVHRRPLVDAITLTPAVAALGCATRQLAEVEVTPTGLVASVEPAVVPRSHPLGRVDDEWNAVTVESASAGTIVLSGPGAGGDATAGALYADIGAGGPPLPLPSVARVAARDERRCAWLVRSRSPDAVVACASNGASRPVRGAGGDGALHAVTMTRDEVVTFCDQLRTSGDPPAFARDLR
ncbi:MAG: homoserine dehydrogenase [Gemmatimonadetes bacterium]|nr:homoserine dehydrogenase [Gemmatimonadota bacterium]